MNYRREIDGLRALAVMPVILFHAGFDTFSGGYVGVDVFFVISGYLITSLILAEKQAGSFSLINFYERRARRILPALFLVMFACIPFAWLWLIPGDMADFSKSLTYVSVFASNILFYKQSGYFDTASELKPLLHTWSLAVEEQYYLIFPVLMLFIWRLGKRWIAAILAVITVTSLFYTQHMVTFKPEAAFYLLPTRVWELLLGALIAFCPPIKQPKIAVTGKFYLSTNQSASFIGLLLIIYATVAFDKNTPFPSFYALVPTVGAAIIILFANPQTVIGKVLGSKLLVGIGLISYSTYLWHQPLLAFERHRSLTEPNAFVLWSLIVFAFCLAYISWRFVEVPFRRKDVVSRTRFFSLSLVVTMLFTTLGFWGYSNDGFRTYYVKNRLNESYRNIHLTVEKHTGGDIYLDMGDEGKCNFWAKTTDAAFNSRFKDCAARHGKAIVILGDSHAMNIYNAFFRAEIGSFVVGVSQGGCRPYERNVNCHYAEFDSFIKENGLLIQLVIFHQSGSYLLKNFKGQVDSADIFAKGENYQIYYDNIQKVADYLQEMSRQVDVLWLGPFVEARVDFKNYGSFLNGYEINGVSIKVFDHLEKELKTLFPDKNGGIKYVSLADILKIEKNFLMVGECLTYRDTDHFSVCGESIIGKKLKDAYARGVFQ